jgi:dolichyl-phosphate beta-glucosyltransferase
MNEQKYYISVVIPVYNEEKRITAFLQSVVDYVINKTFFCEIVIVDDGSVDRTVEIIESMLREKLPGKFRTFRLPQNRGKGAAIRKGMLEAQGDYIFFLDADGSTSIAEIDNFIPQFSPEFDIYIATRTIKHKAPFKRKFFGYGYIYLANLLLGLKIADFTCGFKCYTQPSAKKIFSRQLLNNWSFDAEDIFIAQKNGYKIKETPVHWQHVGGSKVKVFKNVLMCGVDLLRIRYNNYKGLYQ